MSTHRHKEIIPDATLGAAKIAKLQRKIFWCFHNASKDQETRQYLDNLEQDWERLQSNIQSVKITPLIDEQLSHITSTEGMDKLEKLMLAFNTTFAVNDCIAKQDRIEGSPGSLILNSHLIRKALGEDVDALTLQSELHENGINRSKKICNMVNILANYYIDNNITFIPQKAPSLFTQPN